MSAVNVYLRLQVWFIINMSAGLKMEIILSYLRDCCFDETKKIVVLMKLRRLL